MWRTRTQAVSTSTSRRSVNASRVPRGPPASYRAAAERDHGRLCRRERDADGVRLDRAESRSRRARRRARGIVVPARCSIARVDVENAPPEPRRDLAPERRLPRAHEPDERQVPVERVQCHWIRSKMRGGTRQAATKSPSASPPNFSRAARASSHATAASATTASASTAATSERSTSASAGSPVARSTDGAASSASAAASSRRGRRSPRRSRRPPRSRRRGSSRRRRSVLDLVVRLRADLRREREAVADLDALDRLDPHHRRGQPRVEAVLLRGVGAETRRTRARAPRSPLRRCRARAGLVDRGREALLVDRRAPTSNADRASSASRRRRPPRGRPCAAPRRARASCGRPRGRT